MQDAEETPPFPWRGACAAALVLAALFAGHNALTSGSNPREWTLGPIIVNQLIVWGLWLAMLPAILTVARGWWGSRRGAGAIVWQLAVGLLAAVLHPAFAGLLRWAFGISLQTGVERVIGTSVVYGFAPNVLRYALIAAACHAFLYHHEVRRQDARAARLEAGAVEAQLESLRARLNPHFLFNTLNSIGALIVHEPKAAQEMLERFSELLRATLTGGGRREVTLAAETTLLREYVAIQRMRFRERLEVVFDVPAALSAALVPHMILQPVVENAVQHGIAPREQGGRIAVRAARDGRTLRLIVEDDGPGPAARGASGTGFGLGSTASRIAHLYGAGADLAMVSMDPQGTRVTIRLPLRLSESHADDQVA